jgi:hypothetical protein
MCPRRKAPSKSTAAASPAASPAAAHRNTRLASHLYGTEQSPNVGILALATSSQGDETSNEALFHDISVQEPSLSFISENAPPVGNAHELTSLFTVAASLSTTKDNFNISKFGSDDKDEGDDIDASICEPEDDRKLLQRPMMMTSTLTTMIMMQSLTAGRRKRMTIMTTTTT